jgi:hypothetical protein
MSHPGWKVFIAAIARKMGVASNALKYHSVEMILPFQPSASSIVR